VYSKLIQIGKDLWRIRNTTKLDHVISGAHVVRFMKAQKIKWLGHVQKMDTSRVGKRILEWKPMGR
jgi:hypothetical protein